MSQYPELPLSEVEESRRVPFNVRWQMLIRWGSIFTLVGLLTVISTRYVIHVAALEMLTAGGGYLVLEIDAPMRFRPAAAILMPWCVKARELRLAGSCISDSDLRLAFQWSDMAELEGADLSNTAISDIVAPEFRSLAMLKRVNVAHARITTRGIMLIAGNDSVEAIYVDSQQIIECQSDMPPHLLRKVQYEAVVYGGDVTTPAMLNRLTSDPTKFRMFPVRNREGKGGKLEWR